MHHQKGFAVFFLPLIVGSIFIAGYLLIKYNQNQNRFLYSIPTEESIKQSKTATETPKEEYPIDTEINSVYTNSVYKFTFTYPGDIFKYKYLNAEAIDWFNVEWDNSVSDPVKTNKEVVGLELYVADKTLLGDANDDKENRNFHIAQFNELFKADTGTAVSWGAIKLSQSETDKYKSITYFYETPSTVRDEYNINYGAWWLKKEAESPVIQITFRANNKDELQKYKPQFDLIVNRFKFTN